MKIQWNRIENYGIIERFMIAQISIRLLCKNSICRQIYCFPLNIECYKSNGIFFHRLSHQTKTNGNENIVCTRINWITFSKQALINKQLAVRENIHVIRIKNKSTIPQYQHKNWRNFDALTFNIIFFFNFCVVFFCLFA